MNTRILKYQGWAYLWVAIILLLCNIKLSDSAGGSMFFEGFDKMVHLGFFFVLTILMFYGKMKMQNSYAFCHLTILKIILFTGLLGGGIELIQWKIFTWRSAEWWDFYSDMIGVFMGIFSYAFLHFKHYNEKTL